MEVTLRKTGAGLSGDISYDYIQINNQAANALRITVRRTLRVPDDPKTYALPDCGQHKLYSTPDLGEESDQKFAGDGGIVVPVYGPSSI